MDQIRIKEIEGELWSAADALREGSSLTAAEYKEPLHKDIKSELDRITFSVMDKLGNHFDYYESAVNDRTK